MKILFTQDALVNAGAERSHIEILSRFSAGVEVLLVYFYPKHDLKDAVQDAGIPLHFLDIPESYSFGTAISRLVHLIRKEKPDLLVSSLYRADIITRMASLITGVPLVGTLVNDSYCTYSWQEKKGIKYRLVWLLDRMTAGIPTYWIANADSLVDAHERTLGIRPEKVSVVYRGRVVGDSSWQPVTEIRHFISYGRFLERKGFQDLISAFAEVQQHYPDCTLTIYGEGNFRKQLEDLVQILKLQESVKLPGKVADPTDLLLTADCFVFPSWFEGFSGSLVEAMLSGIPIIASDIPMNLEAVTADKNALTFTGKDIAALSQQMRYAIEHPALMNELGSAARLEAMERFDIEKIAKEYEGVLRSIAAQNTPPRPSP